MAIIAVIIATAGWTTVGVLVINDQPAAAASSLVEPEEPIDETEFPPEDEPLPESHTYPDLEALVPPQIDGTPLVIQSFSGADLITDDPWGTSMTAFLTSVGKTPADLQLARAEDPEGLIDLDAILLFRLPGVEPEALRDAIINGWRVDFPELATSSATVASKEVTTGTFGEDTPGSTWYIHDGVVFDVESYDETLTNHIVAALPPATAPAPASAPAASVAPSASPAP